MTKTNRTNVFNNLGAEHQKLFMQSLSDVERRTFVDSLGNKGKTTAFNALEVTERTKYLNNMVETERTNFIDTIRQQAVQDFWNNERELIKQGRGTRDWTPEQMEAILNVGENGLEKSNARRSFQMDEYGEMDFNR